MAQFTLRALLVLTTLVAEGLALAILGGWRLVVLTVVIGLVIGGCLSFLVRRSKLGVIPLVAALTGAMASAIVGVYLVGFQAEDWNNPLGKTPYGLDDLFWYAFGGALVGAALGIAVGKRRRSWRDK